MFLEWWNVTKVYPMFDNENDEGIAKICKIFLSYLQDRITISVHLASFCQSSLKNPVYCA
jgi:hypothetical protein